MFSRTNKLSKRGNIIILDDSNATPMADFFRVKMRNPFQRRPKSFGSSTTGDSGVSMSAPAFPSPSVKLHPGDQPQTFSTGCKVSAIEIRELNELIRKRYGLDVEIWSLKDCKPRDRHLVVDKMNRSDTALLKILTMVHTWDNPSIWKSPEDWHRLRAIKMRLDLSGKRIWAENPPWDP